MKASLPFRYIIAIKNGKQYVVFDYKDSNVKRKRKWVDTGLSEKCAKKALDEKVEKIVAEFYESYLSGNMSVSEPKKHSAPTSVINPASFAESITDYSLVDYLQGLHRPNGRKSASGYYQIILIPETTIDKSDSKNSVCLCCPH